VVTRRAAEYTPPDGAKVHRLEALSLPVSSSEIRAALAQGDVHPPDLDPRVYRYIVQQKLYAEPDRI
jgi:nicotinic acid mononucleotide adenylyltransferase